MTIQNSKLINWLLGITTFLIPFYIFRFKIYGIPTNPFEIGVFLSLVATVIQYPKTKRQSSNNNQKPMINIQNNGPIIHYSLFIILLISFLVSCLLGSWRAGWSLASLGVIKSWVVVPMLFGWLISKTAFSFQLSALTEDEKSDLNVNKGPGLRLIADTYNLKAVFLGLYVSAILISIWAILQKFGVITTLFYQVGDSGFSQYLGANFRAFGSFESPNYLAMFLVPASILSVALNLEFNIYKLKLWKGAFYLSYILPLSALFLTYSRAGLIAFGAAVLAFILVKIKPRKASPWWNVFILPTSVLILAMIYKMWFRPDSDEVRLKIYYYAWQMVVHNPVLGIGIGKFQGLIESYAASDPSFISNGLPYALHPHNLYLALWLNFGLLGLISFTGTVAVFIKQVLSKPQNLLLFAAMVAILVHGIFDTTYFKNDLAALFWLIVFVSFNPTRENKEI